MAGRTSRLWDRAKPRVSGIEDVLPPALRLAPENIPEWRQPNPGDNSKDDSPELVFDEQKYGSIQTSPFATSATANQATKILDVAPGLRVFLLVQNNSTTTNMQVFFGGTAVGITLLPSQSIFLDTFVPQDQIFVAGSGASLVGTLAYANKKAP